MKPQRSLLKHLPEQGQYGDCFRACIASILEMPMEDVPHFMADGSAETGYPAAIEWLGEFGWSLVSLPMAVPDLDTFMRTMGSYFDDVHYILTGTSKRGFQHMVVGNGQQIVHDPTYDEPSITGPCGDGYFWIHLVVVK